MASLAVESPVRNEREVIASLVERYLEPHQKSDFRIVVYPEAIIRGSGRWLVQVGIEPEGTEVRASDFIDRFLAANQDLDRDYPRYIRLTQMVPQPGEVL